MRTFLVLLSLFCFGILNTKADHYAVLAAGSSYFWNYRHQADVFHAYQILTKYGIPPENIITFAYNDIVNNSENPLPGQMFNKPSTGPGQDVYAGVVIDYLGDDVTSLNFLNALKGDSDAAKGKKVLKSTSEDHVFIYYADHGAAGLLAFPEDGDFLYADDFIKTLNEMSDKGKYKQMVIFVEACNSGSLFDGLLPDNINIYATTAANSEESSWATYCNPNNTVNGVSLKTCIGDLYSVNFLENLESVDPSAETLEAQFEIILKKTTKSHVEEFGQLDITSEVIGQFEGNDASKAPLFNKSLEDSYEGANIDSRMVKLLYLMDKHQSSPTAENQQALEEEIQSIVKFDNIFGALSQKFSLNLKAPVQNINFSCLKQRVSMYQEFCGSFSDYGMKYIQYIYYTCSQGVTTLDYETFLLQECSQTY